MDRDHDRGVRGPEEAMDVVVLGQQGLGPSPLTNLLSQAIEGSFGWTLTMKSTSPS